MQLRRFVAELRRRRVLRAGAIYAAGAFAFVQAVDIAVPALALPPALLTGAVVLALVGAPVALGLAWFYDLSLSGITRETAAPPVRRPLRSDLPWLVASALVIVGLTAFGTYRGDGVREAMPRSVAVLPFRNLSADPEALYFSDGIAEETLHALGQVAGLSVAARTSSFAFRDEAMDVREIARRLGVASIVEGSVRRRGDRVVITVHLLNAATGYELWSQRYDRLVTDVFAVQAEIAQQIARALDADLRAGGSDVLVERGSSDAEAVDLYMRGRYAWNRRGSGVAESVNYYHSALERDSSFALAWAGLADALLLRAYYGGAQPLTAWREARDAAQRALQLDPSLVQPQAALAYGRMLYEWDWAAAEAGFRAAIAANPSYANAHHWLGDLLSASGRLEEGVAALAQAYLLDPLAAAIITDYAYKLLSIGRGDEAERLIRTLLETQPSSFLPWFARGRIRLAQGRGAEAASDLERAVELSGRHPLLRALRARALAVAGDSTGARAIFRQLEAEAETTPLPAQIFVDLYLAIDNDSLALVRLRTSLERREPLMVESLWDPLYDDLRDEPGYADILRMIGLEPTALDRT